MKYIKWLDRNFEVSLLVIALIFMVFIMTAQIIARYVFGSSFSWSEELTRYLFIWSGFLSVSLTLRSNTAMKLDVLIDFMPKLLMKIVTLIANLLMLAFFMYFMVVSFDVVGTMTQKATTMDFSMKWVYAASTIGFALTNIRLIQMIIESIRSFAKNDKNSEMGGGEHVGN